MDVSLDGVELLVKKIGIGEEKNRNRIGTSPHNFHVFLHKKNPLKLVVLQPVRVIIAKWIYWVNKI